jgi:signal transduction histidine kinase
MLAHSRIGSGERQLLDLNTLAQEAWHLAYQVARTKDSTFEATLRLAPDPAVGLVNGVAADLNQVLINVFANACYAMAEKKKQLGASYQPEVLLSTHNSGEHAEIRVRDNGIGIPAAAHEKIFQPFFTTKPPGEGTGLGLSLSYDIITKGHGGTLTVLSEEGQFTEITCTLPQQKITTSGASALRKTTSAGELPR